MNRDRTTTTQPGPLCRAPTLHNQYYGTSQEAQYKPQHGGCPISRYLANSHGRGENSHLVGEFLIRVANRRLAEGSDGAARAIPALSGVATPWLGLSGEAPTFSEEEFTEARISVIAVTFDAGANS